MFDLSWWLTCLLLFAGCAVQTALGFGMAVIAAPVIVLYKPEWVPYILTIVALVLSLQNTWRLRFGIRWKHIIPPMISRIPGTILGAWILANTPIAFLQIAVAVMVFVAIFITAFAKPFPSTVKNLSIAGFFSGFAGTTTAIGGPPMALVMQHGDAYYTRANLAVYFAFSCVLSLMSYQAMGLLSLYMWVLGLSFLPAVLLGYVVGVQLQGWVDQRFRTLLLALCSLSALVALYGAVF